MTKKTRVVLSFSSGKDSSWALYRLQQDPEIELVALLTTINENAQRVAMHAVRQEILRIQAKRAALPLWEVLIPSPCSNEHYQETMAGWVKRAKEEAVDAFAFGDLFLQDIRDYREKQLEGSGIRALFPLWGEQTTTLAHEMLSGGLIAHLSCVDPKQLSPEFLGRKWDAELLAELPATVDPCGENGEFHTIVSGGPMFSHEIPLEAGEKVFREGFHFADFVLS